MIHDQPYEFGGRVYHHKDHDQGVFAADSPLLALPLNMKPIRVAIVGLSASAKVSWAANAHLPYLLSQHGKKHYAIVALLNSSILAAENARRTFDLPDAKAYGDPEALASDPDVDLVVNTRADVHFAVVQPSIKAGKAVYVEWPLTHDLASTLELTKDMPKPSKSIVGLQGRVAPITLRLKELLANGVIGQVLSSEVRAYGNLLSVEGLPESVAYFTDRKIGGHVINIHSGHTIDCVHEVLVDWGSFHSKMQIQRPELKVFGQDGRGDEKEVVVSNVPDFLPIHSTLQGNKGVAVRGATLAVFF